MIFRNSVVNVAEAGRGRITGAFRALTSSPVPESRLFDQPPDARLPLLPYGRRLYQALAVARFFTFSMGVGLFFVPSGAVLPSVVVGLLVGMVGLINIGRVLWPPEPMRRSATVELAILTGDVALAVAIVVATGGLDSPFLIYSLMPIFTAGLFLGPLSAAAAASVSALSIIGAHEAAVLNLNDLPRLLDSNYLAFALLYAAGCLLVAVLPFLANLNWQRRLRIVAAEAERQRLRREIHDDVAQTLAFLSLKVQRAERSASDSDSGLSAPDLREIGQVVRRGYMAVRDYLDGSEAPAAEEAVSSSLREAVDEWARSTGLRAAVRVHGREPSLPPSVSRHLVQIAREALANAGKHASPSNVSVILECEGGRVVLRVRDDGIGFTAGMAGGHGLAIMNERADIIGASLAISGEPGKGTEVVVAYPAGEDGAAS